MFSPRPSPDAPSPAESPLLARALLEAGDGLTESLRRLARARGLSEPALALDLLRGAIVRETRRQQTEDALAALTPRQRQVVRLAADGHTNREIARQLWLSPETVKTHLRRALERFGVRSKTELRLLLSEPSGAPADAG